MNKNDLFYLCSLIESISRTTGNTKKTVVNYIGAKSMQHLYNVAEVNHCLPIKQVTLELIEQFNIPIISNTNTTYSNSPSIWEIGKIYSRLIIDLSSTNNWLEKLFEVYNSWIWEYIDDYQKPIYWQSRNYIKECYIENKIL